VEDKRGRRLMTEVLILGLVGAVRAVLAFQETLGDVKRRRGWMIASIVQNIKCIKNIIELMPMYSSFKILCGFFLLPKESSGSDLVF
jgi:hypothetical protein